MGKKVYVSSYVKGYNIALPLADPKVPRQSKVLKDTDKDLLKLRKANQKAYYELILAFHGDIAFGIVEKSVMKDLPYSEANLAWNSLERGFDPKMSSNKLKLKNKFTKFKFDQLEKRPSRLDYGIRENTDSIR